MKLESLDQIEKYARELLAKGAQNVIISMAGDGALLVTSEGAYFAQPIKGTVKIQLVLVILWLPDSQVNLSNQKTQ